MEDEMSNANMSGIPGVGVMTDTLEFVKKMWGGMNIPGMTMPSLSVSDINKQIADLKAVESWLTLNMNMLRGTIQALEVQSATISTLQSMSESMNSMVQPLAPRQERSSHESAFSFAPPTAEKPPVPKSNPEPDSSPESSPRTTAHAIGTDGDAAAMAAQFANPAAWWNMLQDQFKQAVNTAIVPDLASAVKAGRAPTSAKSKAPAKAKSRAAPRKAKATSKP
jgi:hypothetical protein